MSILSVGELVGAVAISLLLRWIYTKYLMLSSLALCGSGGLLFCVGKYGWMLLIGTTATAIIIYRDHVHCP